MFQVGIGNSSRARQANLERSGLFHFKIMEEHKKISIAFHEFYEKTATLDHFSTGENCGKSIDEIWDIFIKQYDNG